MYNILHTYKRTLFLILKLLIVLAAGYFMFEKLTTNELLSISKFKEQLSFIFSKKLYALIGILLLTDANWLLEIFKWKGLVSTLKKITFFEAYEQCFGSHTAAIITPNRIGEYGAKALYFKKAHRKKIIGFNFIGNMSQLITTIVFGCIGLTSVISNYTIVFPKLNLQKVFILFLIFMLLLIFRKHFAFLKIQNYTEKLRRFIKNIPKSIYKKTLLFSIARYLVFSHQFYFLLYLFGVETDYFTLMSLIFCTYFFASIIPSLAIFDWIIKGSIAIWLFQLIDVNELTVITITLFMWVLNFAIPALIGSIFVLNFKTSHLE